VSARTLSRRRVHGFSLIELMVAMLLGLVVIAGVASVFLANIRSYHTNTALADVQDGSRVSFELLARDIRNAGLTGCNNDGRIANVLQNGPASGSTVAWWSDWDGTVRNAAHGYDGDQTDPAVTTGTAAGQRLANTDSLQLLGAGTIRASVESDKEPAANFKLNETTTDLATGDIIIVCDPDHATVLQITDYNNGTVTINHNTGTVTPGNCSKGLGYPTTCTTNGNIYSFPRNSQISKLSATDWYIGRNPAGGSSLYRKSLQTNSSSVPTPETQEMVRNVTDMQILYHHPGATGFATASAITDWTTVDAAKVTLSLQSTDQRAGTDTGPIKRTFTATTTIRNRVN
jgi:type IV pilus assembly protein PilW